MQGLRSIASDGTQFVFPEHDYNVEIQGQKFKFTPYDTYIERIPPNDPLREEFRKNLEEIRKIPGLEAIPLYVIRNQKTGMTNIVELAKFGDKPQPTNSTFYYEHGLELPKEFKEDQQPPAPTPTIERDGKIFEQRTDPQGNIAWLARDGTVLTDREVNPQNYASPTPTPTPQEEVPPPEIIDTPAQPAPPPPPAVEQPPLNEDEALRQKVEEQIRQQVFSEENTPQAPAQAPPPDSLNQAGLQWAESVLRGDQPHGVMENNQPPPQDSFGLDSELRTSPSEDQQRTTSYLYDMLWTQQSDGSWVAPNGSILPDEEFRAEQAQMDKDEMARLDAEQGSGTQTLREEIGNRPPPVDPDTNQPIDPDAVASFEYDNQNVLGRIDQTETLEGQPAPSADQPPTAPPPPPPPKKEEKAAPAQPEPGEITPINVPDDIPDTSSHNLTESDFATSPTLEDPAQQPETEETEDEIALQQDRDRLLDYIWNMLQNPDPENESYKQAQEKLDEMIPQLLDATLNRLNEYEPSPMVQRATDMVNRAIEKALAMDLTSPLGQPTPKEIIDAGGPGGFGESVAWSGMAGGYEKMWNTTARILEARQKAGNPLTALASMVRSLTDLTKASGDPAIKGLLDNVGKLIDLRGKLQGTLTKDERIRLANQIRLLQKDKGERLQKKQEREDKRVQWNLTAQNDFAKTRFSKAIEWSKHTNEWKIDLAKLDQGDERNRLMAAQAKAEIASENADRQMNAQEFNLKQKIDYAQRQYERWKDAYEKEQKETGLKISENFLRATVWNNYLTQLHRQQQLEQNKTKAQTTLKLNFLKHLQGKLKTEDAQASINRYRDATLAIRRDHLALAQKRFERLAKNDKGKEFNKDAYIALLDDRTVQALAESSPKEQKQFWDRLKRYEGMDEERIRILAQEIKRTNDYADNLIDIKATKAATEHGRRALDLLDIDERQRTDSDLISNLNTAGLALRRMAGDVGNVAVQEILMTVPQTLTGDANKLLSYIFSGGQNIDIPLLEKLFGPGGRTLVRREYKTFYNLVHHMLSRIQNQNFERLYPWASEALTPAQARMQAAGVTIRRDKVRDFIGTMGDLSFLNPTNRQRLLSLAESMNLNIDEILSNSQQASPQQPASSRPQGETAIERIQGSGADILEN